MTARLLMALALFALTPAVAAGAAEAPTREVTDEEAEGWKPDLARANDYARGRAGTVTISVRDIRNRAHGRNPSAASPMASTFKVMLMVAYLRQDSVRDRSLDSRDKALIEPMIRRSDNDTASQIDAMLGRGPIENLADRADMRNFRWADTWGLSRTSPADQSRFMRQLRDHVPERHWSYASRQLTKIVPRQRWGIGEVKLRGWDPYFKGGWGSGSGAVDHQIVLLRKNGERIGLAVYTESSPSHEYGKDTLRGVFKRLLRNLPR